MFPHICLVWSHRNHQTGLKLYTELSNTIITASRNSVSRRCIKLILFSRALTPTSWYLGQHAYYYFLLSAFPCILTPLLDSFSYVSTHISYYLPPPSSHLSSFSQSFIFPISIWTSLPALGWTSVSTVILNRVFEVPGLKTVFWFF